MSKRIKLIVAVATIAMGVSTVSASAQSINKKNEVNNTKSEISANHKKDSKDKQAKENKTLKQDNNISQNYALVQSDLLPNSIVYTNPVGAYSNNGIQGVLLSGQISFNKKNMKLSFKNWGGNYSLDSRKGGAAKFAEFDLFNNNLQSKYSLQTYSNQTGRVVEKLNDWTFNYGDIISVWQNDTYAHINFGIANNSEVPKANNNPDIRLTSSPYRGQQTYYKITQNGLVEMNGLYKAPNGNKYYFLNGSRKAVNTWINVDSNGIKTDEPVNGTTVNAYYFGSNGEAVKGLQTINGSIQYLNPETGAMELNKFINLDGKTYYLQPGNGVAAKGLYTIDGNHYYFNTTTGIMTKNTWVNVGSNGFKTDESVNGTTVNAYYFGSNGEALKGLQTINGNIQYLNPQTGAMELNRFIDLDGKMYYLKPGNGVVAKGLQTIDGGNIYYFNATTGVMAENSFVNIGSNGIKTDEPINGTTVKAYYFKNNGVAVKGLQTINGKIYDFNSNTGVMVTNSWETINGSKYYFGSNGEAYTGYKEIDGKVYNFNNEGKLQGETSISINGVNNETVSYGSKFDPMAGVTLNDPADPNAKITVSGTVNTEVPGTYKLTYTVKDSLGQTATAERTITVKNKVSSIVKNISTKYLAWDNGSLVINGNIELNNKIMKKSDIREIMIEDSKGNVVATANGVPVNWYSNNKEDYSGFQGIFSSSELAKLKPGNQYTFVVKSVINGDTVTQNLTNTLSLPNNSVYSLTTNSNNRLTIFKNGEVINSGVGSYEVGYFTNYGYVLNGNINIKGETLSKGVARSLLIKDSNGKTVYDVSMNSMNWYSSNKENYSGFQGIVTNAILNTLKEGEQYSFYVQVKLNGKIYEMKVDNTKGFILSSGINYNIETNKDNTITISKAPRYTVAKEGTGTFENGYWESYGYVMNVKVNLGMNIPKGTKMQLISENELGQIVSVTPGVDVNWYGNDKSDYNGLQAMIIPKQLVEASPTNKLYARVIIDGKAYISPIKGNVNIPIGSSKQLNYGFKTIDGQVNLIMK